MLMQKAAQKKLDDEREKLASEAQGETEGQLRELKEIEVGGMGRSSNTHLVGRCPLTQGSLMPCVLQEKLADAEVKHESRKQEHESMRQHMGQMDQEGARLE
jgi:hypothetical protein